MAPVYLWPLTIAGYALLTKNIIDQDRPRDKAVSAFLFFLGFHICGLYWVSASLFVDFATWWWALPFSLVGLPILCALFPTLLVWATTQLPRLKEFGVIVALPLADIMRGTLFTGFPWNFPIHGFVNTDSVIALLPYIGFYGLNTILIIAAVLIGMFVTNAVKTFICLVLGALVWLVPLSISMEGVTPPANTIMVQANIKQRDKWDPDKMMGNLDRYISMSQSAITSDDPYTIIWPETAISGGLLSYPAAQNAMIDFMEGLPEGSHLITGFLNSHNGAYYNSIIALNRSGQITARYDKHHLVPFGEYMPLGLSTITGFSGFSAGEEPDTINIDDLSFLPLICYEIIFSRYADNGTDVDYILNLTNDSWFGHTAGPYQHLDHARLRAIETGRPILRLSGNGISGWINIDGHVQNQSALNQPAILKY